MKILVDTNILISAVFLPKSRIAKLLDYLPKHHKIALCSTNLTEFREVIARKLPKKISAAEDFINNLEYLLIPTAPSIDSKIRDPKDQPILNAAIKNKVDIILTGDKDFHALHLESPRCMTAAEFITTYNLEDKL